MKRSRIVFFVLIAVFFVAVFLVQYNTPRPFVWTPTYLHDDRQPFGCYVFDDVLASSFDDYRVEQKSLYKVRMEYPDTDPNGALTSLSKTSTPRQTRGSSTFAACSDRATTL